MTTARTRSFKPNRVLLLFSVLAAALAVASVLVFTPGQQAYANQDGLSAAQLLAQSDNLNGKEGTRTIDTGKVYFGSFPSLSASEQEEIGSIEHKYVFTLSKASKVTFEVTTDGEPFVTGDGEFDEGWFGFMLSGDPLNRDFANIIYGTKEWKSGCLYLQPGTYTAIVLVQWTEAGDADGMLGSGYSIRVNAKPAAGTEVEPNDLFKQANPVKLNKSIKGSAYDMFIPMGIDAYAYDDDYYSFKLTKKTKVYLRVLSDVVPKYVKDDLEDQSRLARIFIQKSDESLVYETQVYGAKSWWSKGITLQPGTYRVCLSVAEDNALWGQPYRFTVVEKKANTLTAKPAAKALSAKASKTVKISKKKAFTIKGAKGAVTFAKKSGSKNITVNKKTGVVTVKKGLKANKTYMVKVTVKAAGNKFYKSRQKTVTLKVKVK